jgi:hypothetical protein
MYHYFLLPIALFFFTMKFTGHQNGLQPSDNVGQPKKVERPIAQRSLYKSFREESDDIKYTCNPCWNERDYGWESNPLGAYVSHGMNESRQNFFQPVIEGGFVARPQMKNRRLQKNALFT